MKTTASPRPFRRRTTSKSRSTSARSRLAVGSSRTSTLPDSFAARAMATICCTATENVPSSDFTSMSSP